MKHPLLAFGAAAVAATLALPAHAVTEIQWWHAMTAANNDMLNALADRFNKSQSEYKVVPVYKGSYPETMAATIAAFRAGNPPHITQIFEVGTATMMAARGAIVPVERVMKEGGEKFDRAAYVPAVAGYYTNRQGEMLSFPFNSSTSVFYYNKDALAAAGVAKPPETWEEVAAAAAKVKAAGTLKCAYTTSWPSWVHMENFSAWHNVLMATENNGFGGLNTRLVVNTPLHQRHLTNLADWSRRGWFSYAARTNEGDSKFWSGECAMFTGSSGAYGGVKRNAKFNFGLSKLPYYSDVPGAPQNTVLGGASLWVMSGKKKEDYRGVARFFAFLSSPAVQAEWHQATGYLPVTMAAYELTRKSGFYDKNPGTDVSVQQMIVKTTDKSRGLRLGNMNPIRTIMEEELEYVWGGKKTPKQALDDAVRRGNEQLERFQKMNQGR